MGYTKNVISGFGWHSLLKIATMGVTLLKISILARLLSPNDFGLFAYTMIAFGIVEAITQTGVNLTIINSERKVHYFLDSAWVIAIIRGFIMGISMLLIGLFLAAYYNEPSLRPLVAFTAVVPVIKGFINPMIVILQKNLRFFHDSVYRFSLVIVDALIAIIFGLILKSVIAMIIALIGSALFEVLVSFVAFRDRPTFHYIHSRGKLILNNAKGLSLSAALTYIHENIDDLIIGKLSGTYNLGLYHNAYSLSHKPNFELSKAVQHSTLPVYSRIKRDIERLRRAYLKTSVATLFYLCIATLPIFIFPDLLVKIVLGKQWLGIIPILPWLAGAGLVHSFNNISYNLFYAKENFKVVNLHLACMIAALVVLLLVLTPKMGVAGASMAIFYSRLICLPIIIFEIIKQLRQNDS